MYEHSYLSKPSNKLAIRLSGAFFAAAIITLALISLIRDVPFLGVAQFAAALFFTVAVLLLTRYVFKSFLIKVFESGNGRYDLTVTECRGKNEKEKITVCRVSLSNIESVVVKTKENADDLKKREKGRKVFSYCADLRPATECYIFVTECGEPLLLKLSPDNTLLSILQTACESAEETEK